MMGKIIDYVSTTTTTTRKRRMITITKVVFAAAITNTNWRTGSWCWVLPKTSISDSTSVQYLVVFKEARIAEEEGES